MKKTEFKKLTAALMVLSMSFMLITLAISMPANAETTFVTTETELKDALNSYKTDITISGSTIVIDSGSLTINPGVTLTITSTPSGPLAVLSIQSDATLTVKGTIIIDYSGMVSSSGTFNNMGTITIKSMGTLTVGRDTSIVTSAVPGTFNNMGTINNSGFIRVVAGSTTTNTGTINNAGTITPDDAFNNNGGVFNDNFNGDNSPSPSDKQTSSATPSSSNESTSSSGVNASSDNGWLDGFGVWLIVAVVAIATVIGVIVFLLIRKR